MMVIPIVTTQTALQEGTGGKVGAGYIVLEQ